MSIKKRIIDSCPRLLLKVLVGIKRLGRTIEYKVNMALFSKKLGFSCPCCGMRFKSFVSGDFNNRPRRFNPKRYEGMRQDVLCPFCKSLPRHRILADWCDRNKSSLIGKRILYFAPEYSMMIWMKKNKISLTTADLYNEADLKLDIQATGLDDESCDVIICNHVLEHVNDFRIAISEMYRIVKTGGCFICSFPMDPKVEFLDEDSSVVTEEQMLDKYGQNDHKRVFGMKADIFLEDAGFEVERIVGENCPDEILPIVGPADYDMNCLFYCKKNNI